MPPGPAAVNLPVPKPEPGPGVGARGGIRAFAGGQPPVAGKGGRP
jgi:hypothetical protein